MNRKCSGKGSQGQYNPPGIKQMWQDISHPSRVFWSSSVSALSIFPTVFSNLEDNSEMSKLTSLPFKVMAIVRISLVSPWKYLGIVLECFYGSLLNIAILSCLEIISSECQILGTNYSGRSLSGWLLSQAKCCSLIWFSKSICVVLNIRHTTRASKGCTFAAHSFLGISFQAHSGFPLFVSKPIWRILAHFSNSHSFLKSS